MTIEKYNELTRDFNKLLKKQTELFDILDENVKRNRNSFEAIQERVMYGASASEMREIGCEMYIADIMKKYVGIFDNVDMHYLLAYALVQIPEVYPKLRSMYNKKKRNYETIRMPEDFKYYGLSIVKITYFRYIYKMLTYNPALFAQLFALFKRQYKNLSKEIKNFDWYIHNWIHVACVGLFEMMLTPMLFLWDCDIAPLLPRFKFMPFTLIMALYIMEQAFKYNYPLPGKTNDFYNFLKGDDIKTFDDIEKYSGKFNLRWDEASKLVLLIQYLIDKEPRFLNTDASWLLRMAKDRLVDDDTIDKLLPSSSESDDKSEIKNSFIDTLIFMFSGLQKQYADDIEHYLKHTEPVIIKEPDTESRAELESIKAQLETMEQELIGKKQEIVRLNTIIAEIKREEEGYRLLLNENRKLKDKVHSLKESLKTTQEEYKELQECMFHQTDTERQTDIDFDLDSVKAIVVGGHPNWISKYKPNHPNWTFYEIEQARFDTTLFRNADCIIVVSSHMCHSVYEKVIRYCRLYKKKLIYLNSANSVEKCDNIIKNAMVK